MRYNGNCNTTTCASLSVTVDQFTAASAGTDQSVCATTATLAGNTPATGGGTWTLVSGSGTITTPSSDRKRTSLKSIHEIPSRLPSSA